MNVRVCASFFLEEKTRERGGERERGLSADSRKKRRRRGLRRVGPLVQK
jgi:hypothetical protein